jgi:hypothetical protein
MKNLTKFEDFVLEAEIGDSPLQDHLKAQKDFDAKIADLQSKLKKAINSEAEAKEINKLKLGLRITQLSKELEGANWKMSQLEKGK